PRDVRRRHRALRAARRDDADEPDRHLRGARVQHERVRARSPRASHRKGAAMSTGTHWVGTWTAAPAPAEGAAFANHTLRMMPRVSLGGSTVRVRLSNAYGVRPLAVGAAWVGVRSTGPGVVAGSNR